MNRKLKPQFQIMDFLFLFTNSFHDTKVALVYKCWEAQLDINFLFFGIKSQRAGRVAFIFEPKKTHTSCYVENQIKGYLLFEHFEGYHNMLLKSDLLNFKWWKWHKKIENAAVYVVKKRKKSLLCIEKCKFGCDVCLMGVQKI